MTTAALIARRSAVALTGDEQIVFNALCDLGPDARMGALAEYAFTLTHAEFAEAYDGLHRKGLR